MTGGGGSQTVTQKSELPAYLQPYSTQLATTAGNVAQGVLDGSRPMPQFDAGYAVQPLNGAQGDYGAGARNLFMRSTPGMQALDTGSAALTGAANMWGLAHQAGVNPYQDMYVEPGLNPMMGQDNPYLQNMINRATQDTTNAYRSGTASQLDSAAARSRALGGSGYQEQVAANERQLGDVLGNQVNNLRAGDYNQQIGLQENAINRAVSAQQQDLQRNAGLAQANIGLNEQNWQNVNQWALQAAGLAPGMIGAEVNAINPSLQFGNMQYAVDQSRADYTMQQALQQAYPELFGMDILSRGLSGALGSGGTTTTQMSGGGANPAAQWIGAGLLGASLPWGK